MIKAVSRSIEIFVKWFTVSRVIITCWNAIIFFYHFLWIGMTPWTSITIQGTALIVEYFVSGIYERTLLLNNIKINRRTKSGRFRLLRKMMIKYLVFTGIFVSIFVSTYYLRLGILYVMDLGITTDQLGKTILNMVWFTPVAAPIMAAIVIERKKKTQQKKKKLQKA
ncbi:MAG: hypothetical protein WCJ45_03480 [bacterium]